MRIRHEKDQCVVRSGIKVFCPFHVGKSFATIFCPEILPSLPSLDEEKIFLQTNIYSQN
jgi:hypothetical protein